MSDQTQSPFVVIDDEMTAETFGNLRRQYSERLINKWMWLIEGTKKQNLSPIAPRLWEPMAHLFENQQAVSRGLLSEATTKDTVTLPEKFALPIIRRVYPNLIAAKICSIQAMPLLSGGVARGFYLDFLREDVSPETETTDPDSDYAISEENAVPKRLKMRIEGITITAIKDILGASWSTEVMEDARGALGIDVESELVNEMAAEIMREIDQRILNEILLWASAGNINWTWDYVAANETAKQHYETLGHAMIDAEDLIYAQRYRSAQWVVGGRHFVSFIRKMQDFKPEPRTQPPDAFRMGVELVGRVEGYWDVYLTTFINTNRAIMGVYPTTQLDTGYIYMPYIPLAPMPLMYAEFLPYDDSTLPGAYVNTDKWSRNVRTRYGKRLVVPQLYSTLAIYGT